MNAASNATPKFELNIIQLIAGALAAVTAAVVASFIPHIGAAGTVIGTGVASLVATTGTAVYSHSIRRTGARLRGVRGSQPATVQLPGQPLRPQPRQQRGVRWQTVAVSALLAFVLAMAAITAFELGVGRALGDVLAGRSQPSKPTIAQLTQPGPTSAPAATLAPTTMPTLTPTPESTPTPRPSPSAAASPAPSPP